MAINLVGVLIPFVTGGIAGATTSALLSARNAQNAEVGKRRYEAINRIRSTLAAYRDHIAYQHSQITVSGTYMDYVSRTSIDELAEDVAREVIFLPRKRVIFLEGQRAKLQKELMMLVGPLTLKLAEGRAFIPEKRRLPEEENARLAEMMGNLIREKASPTSLTYGQLGEVNANPTDEMAYTTALATLNRMIEKVKP